MHRRSAFAALPSQLTPESPSLKCASICLKNETLAWPSDTADSPWLAANPVIRCGRLQRTLEDDRADRRGNYRDVNRLERKTGAGPCRGWPQPLAAHP